MEAQTAPQLKLKPITAVEFEAWLQRPENAERFFELIEGEIVEVPSNLLSSEIAILIAAALLAFVRPRKIGHVTGEQGGYQFSDNSVIAPDVAFISTQRQETLSYYGFGQVPPDLAVEIISPTDKVSIIRRKLALYAEMGTLVWLVYPERQLVEVYAPDAPVEIVDIDSEVSGGAVLPGFSLKLRDFLVSG